MLRLLTEDNDLDVALKLGAEFFGKPVPAPYTSELQADLAMRHRSARTTSDFTASIVEDYLMPGTDGKSGARAIQKRKDQVNRLIMSEDANAQAHWANWPNEEEPSLFLLQHYPDSL